MSWFFLILLISFIIFSGFSEGSHDPKQSAVVVGTVYCDTCFQQDFSRISHFISGASVAVECKDGTSSRPSFRQEVKTKKHGEFKVHLPFWVSKHVKQIKGCSVKLIRSSEPYCAVASTATSSSLHLKSRKHGTHIFSAGFFTFKPLNQPILCNQKPNVHNPKQLKNNEPSKPSVFPSDHEPVLAAPIVYPNQLQPPILLPPNPFQPPPLLPPNPFEPPPAPLIPNPFQPPPAPLIPNPFQPPSAPPAPLIPNPFQPPSAPAAPLFPVPPISGLTPPSSPPPPLIPNQFQPPPAPPAPLIPDPFQPPSAPAAPLFPIPPISGLTPPSSPPPPPPDFPFPFPPFPFLPEPPFPDVPPASTLPRKSSP